MSYYEFSNKIIETVFKKLFVRFTVKIVQKQIFMENKINTEGSHQNLKAFPIFIEKAFVLSV